MKRMTTTMCGTQITRTSSGSRGKIRWWSCSLTSCHLFLLYYLFFLTFFLFLFTSLHSFCLLFLIYLSVFFFLSFSSFSLTHSLSLSLFHTYRQTQTLAFNFLSLHISCPQFPFPLYPHCSQHLMNRKGQWDDS